MIIHLILKNIYLFCKKKSNPQEKIQFYIFIIFSYFIFIFYFIIKIKPQKNYIKKIKRNSAISIITISIK